MAKFEKWLEEDNLLRLAAWARDGLTDEEISIDKIGISRSTLSTWKIKFPQIADALKRGKDVADIEVENSLFKRATGYSYNEIKEEYEKDTLMRRIVTTKHVPAETAAICFWLKNRKRDTWNDCKDTTNINTEIEDLTPLAELLR